MGDTSNCNDLLNSTSSINDTNDLILHYDMNTKSLLIDNFKSHKILKLDVFSVQGQRVYTNEYFCNQNEIRTNLSFLASGLYIVKIQTECDIKTTKIIIEN
jgi:hypothetical protein